MNKKDPNNCISYLNLCKDTVELDQKVKSFFNSQNYSVIPYLKEINNYVAITADYPIDRNKLLNILDPYRKFCDTILLVIVFKKKTIELSFPWHLTEFRVTDIVFVDDEEQILEHIQTHFNRYAAINKLIHNKDNKELNEDRYTITNMN
jgi:hypothetical protein